MTTLQTRDPLEFFASYDIEESLVLSCIRSDSEFTLCIQYADIEKILERMYGDKESALAKRESPRYMLLKFEGVKYFRKTRVLYKKGYQNFDPDSNVYFDKSHSFNSAIEYVEKKQRGDAFWIKVCTGSLGNYSFQFDRFSVALKRVNEMLEDGMITRRIDIETGEDVDYQDPFNLFADGRLRQE